jgi:hypothetical protein
LTEQTVEGVSFASLPAAMDGVDPSKLTQRPLLKGENFAVDLVVWPPNSARYECIHSDFVECALIVKGSIIDEDEREHEAGALWQRPSNHVHHPRAGADGARLLLIRVSR